METPADTHVARAASGNIPGLYRARCCCGWRGSIVGDESTANAEADAHMRDGAADSAPPEPDRGTSTHYPPERRHATRRVAERRLGDPNIGPSDTLSLLVDVLARESTLIRTPLSGDSFLTPGWNA